MVKIDEEDMALTQTGHAVGTPWYMPLEQAKNAKDTDGRSDIYALGCMVYCMLTGTPPFAGKTLVDVIQAKEIGTFPPARQSCSDVPERLDLIIVKMTAKHPKYRYQTCGELVKDLESLNLANLALSFLADEEDSGPALSDPGVATSADTRPDYDPNIWYVRIKDPDGRAIVKKLPTAQVHKLLEEDTLAPNTKASHQAHEGFRALATYKEFQGIALVKASQQAVDQQSVRYRTLYKKIEEKERQRQEDENPQAKTPDWLADLQPLLRSYGPLVFGALLGLVALVWLVRSFWR
jgi:serine/threonine protein kinase